MQDPLYPDVPQTPGVPPVFSSLEFPTSDASTPAMTADAPTVAQGATAAWGIYTDAGSGGKLALACDSVLSVEPGKEYRISDFPVANGGFQSYNKVERPGEDRITVTKGGSTSDREAFLNSLATLAADTTNLYSIVMPDQTLQSRSITHFSYGRSAERGAQLLTVEISLEEVRQTATQAFTDTTQPSGASTTQGGPVQPTTPTISQTPIAVPVTPIDPTLYDLPPITSDMTQVERGAATSGYIDAGASIGQLVTKGVSFQAIPLTSNPAQSLTAYIGQQSVKLDISQKATGLFTDVYVNDALIIGGVPVENDNPIVRSAYLGFSGDLYFHDTQGGLDDVSYSDLGSRIALLYAGA